MHICEAAAKLHPGTSWNFDGINLTQAIDEAPRIPVPSLTQLQPIMDSDIYIAKRMAEYPSIGDQLDALWQGGQVQADMLAKIQAIKAKYPKPM